MEHSARPQIDTSTLCADWQHLHKLDAEPLPHESALLQGWALFHAGHFEEAELAGLTAGLPGLSLANRAAATRATFLVPGEKARLDLFQRIHARCRAHSTEDPANPNAWFWLAYALIRYSQGIHVARALAQGLGTQIRCALERTLELAPSHAYAHLALGSFHAAVIDKVGPLIGAITYGAKAAEAMNHLREALRLAPDSAAVMVEYADALIALEGEQRLDEATQLYEQASNVAARDAAEQLWINLAREGLTI